MTSKRRAVGIVRVSQVNGRQGESFHSPDTQAERIREACERNDWKLIETLPPELDVSGGKPLAQRPSLRRAVEAVEAGSADVIVVAYFDRLVRSIEVQTEVVRRVEAAGGDVHTIDFGSITNGNATQRMTSHFLGAVAQYHRDLSAEKSREAQVSAIAQGVAPWPRISPGYQRGDDGVLVPDPAVSDAVAEAFRLRADGATVAEVREHLARHDIVRSYHGVSSLLASRVVLGELHFGDYEPNLTAWPAIVDRDTWGRVQRMVVSRGRRAKSERLLARLGILRCGTCGARMTVGTQTQNGRRYPFYRCPPTGDCSRRVTISAEIAEEVVVDAIRAYLDGCMGVRAAQDNVRAATLALARAQEDLDAGLRTLADFTDEPAARERLIELRRVRDEAREKVDQLGAPTDSTVLLLAGDWDELSANDQRRCIRAILNRVEVKPAVRGLSPQDRIDVVYHDGIDVLQRRTPPLPARLEAGPVRLLPVAERDKALKNHLETTHFFEATGELYDPPTPPEVGGWGEDDEDVIESQ